MNEVNSEPKKNSYYPPPTISVEFRSQLFVDGLRVYFSKFFIPPEIDLQVEDEESTRVLRGIANIAFSYPKQKISKEDEVDLKVYITQDENERRAQIFVLKENTWVNKGGNFNVDLQEPWAGYLLATIKLGDPPIAVG